MVNLPKQLQGCKIFPIIRNAKRPAVAAWQKVASSDLDQIAEWERQYPGCNWGIPMGLNGFLGYDIDCAGFIWWQRLQDENQIVREAVNETFRVRTPKGGYHYYFKGEGYSGASRIAEGIDTRGGILQADGSIDSSGYLVMPGSHTEEGPGCLKGDYVVEHDAEILALPQYLKDIIPIGRVGEVKGLSKNPDFDQPRNVEWSINILKGYVEKGSVAIEGKGGDDLTIATATAVLSKAISPQKCYDLMQEHWNPHCVPPWDDWELELKIRNAFNSGQNTKTGAEGFLSNADAFAGFTHETPAATRKGRFRPMLLSEARKDVRPASWLIPGFIPSQGVGILYGLSGSYKTFLALDWAMTLASGIAGQWGTAPVKHKILFLAGESSYALQQQRVDSWCEANGMDVDDCEFVIVRGVPAYTDTEGWQEIRQGLIDLNFIPDFIVIDTLARAMAGMKENDNDDAKRMLKFCEELSDHYGCFTLAVGHTGKDQSRGLRGAQAFIDYSDAVLTVSKLSNGIVTLKVKKLKEVDAPDDPYYLSIEPYGASIALKRTEQVPEVATEKKNGSRYAWASVEEVTKVLIALGGETSSSVLAQEIAGHHGLDASMVRRKLMNSDDLAWLRPTDGKWAMPKKMEYDL